MPYQPLQPSSSLPQNYAQMNKALAQLNQEAIVKKYGRANGQAGLVQGRLPNSLGYGTLFYDSGGTPLIYMAVDGNGNPILKVAKNGKDATTASGEDLVFNSSQSVFKVVKSGIFSTPGLDAAGGANDTNTTVTNTGYASTAPVAYQAYVVNDSGGYNQLPLMSVNYSGLFQIIRTMAVELSGGTVQLRTYSQNFTGFATSAVTIKYYLFAESVV